ncbi:hypothetical protein HX793_00405 [Pseudomonas reactans]|uniref:HEPN domain-containing protein n=1 Tax=Pseudomonas reactans TaxID=117680 RepID=UPI0015A15401|nr:HEPN domain-containing protein [Pseudomonas reactans]NWC86960.1 hypothetical protein [Pseudomonas reactans]NWD28214.1 hypothetical protein [Pseudomonas reactans]
MKTEFLILVPDDESFCNSKKAFVDFLKIDSLVSITGNTITFRRTPKGRDQVSAKFRIETDKVKSNNERYFLLIIECDEQNHIDEFSELSDRLKTIAERISPGSTVVNMLWDGVGRIYAEKAYPIINEVENLMRRLIAKFMLITVGMHWSRDAINSELSKKIEKFEENDPYLNDLHKLDFIHLSQVLFEKKRDISLDELDRTLLKTKFDEEDKERILKYIPRSNWEKYFSALVEDKGHGLEAKWEILYKLRNKVAHNRSVKKAEFEKINGLATSIKEIIRKATEKLGEIDINEEDRELIKHSYRKDAPTMMMGYLAEKAVSEYYVNNGYEITQTLDTNRDQSFDFFATKDGETVSVVVKSVPVTTAFITVLRTLTRIESIMSKIPHNDRLGIHLVCIIRGDGSEHFNENVTKIIKQNLPEFSINFEIYSGFINENNSYTAF